MDFFSEIRQRPILKIPNLPNPVGEPTMNSKLSGLFLVIDFWRKIHDVCFPIYERDQHQVFPEYGGLLLIDHFERGKASVNHFNLWGCLRRQILCFLYIEIVVRA